jgi:RNA polymerase sigma-70 factor (ECF subfamily)
MLTLDEKKADFSLRDAPETPPADPVLLLSALSVQKPRLRRIIAGMGFGHADIDDLLQDITVQAANQSTVFPTAAHAALWLTRTTVNRCITEYRCRARFKRSLKEILLRRKTATAPAAHTEAIRKEHLQMIRKAMTQLKPELYVPLQLRYFCKLNATEIGEILSLKPTTVRTRLRDARLHLAKVLKDQGMEP